MKPRDSERGQSSYSPRNPSVPRGETINTALETSQTALRPRRGREGRDEEGREAPGPRAEASQAGPGATAGNKAPGMGSGKGRRARGWGLTRACRSSWEWRLEPFSRWTIRAMVRESPLSGSSIAARSGSPRGAHRRTAFPAAPRLLHRRYQATAGARPVLPNGGRVESGASQKGSPPPAGTRAGQPALRGTEPRRPLAAQTRRPRAVPRAGDTHCPQWRRHLPPLPGHLAGSLQPAGRITVA